MPTACFGVLLAHATLTTGSVIPGMVMHALNNAMALLLAADAWPGLASTMTARPALFLAGSLALCAMGIVLIRPAHPDPG